MADTSQLHLPLLAPSQAQKQVTVNEAFVRLDGLTQMVLQSRTTSVPPLTGNDGVSYGVPSGAVNAWSGQDGTIAIWSNGGWLFVAPQRGWRAWVADESTPAIYDGAEWQLGPLALSAHGAGTFMRVDEFDHTLGAGPTSTTVPQIPGGVMMVAVTARVLEAITGAATSWQLGSAGASDRFGSGLGLGVGAYARGMLSQPMTYWSATPLLLTATGGDFAAGKVRFALHYLDISVPGL